MSEQITDLDDGGQVPAPSYQVAKAGDRHVVWLTDLSGFPLFERPSHKHGMVVRHVEFVYARPYGATEWTLVFVGVIGPRAKKDGTASAGYDLDDSRYASVDEPFVRDGASYGRGLQGWLYDLAAKHRPTSAVETTVSAPTTEMPGFVMPLAYGWVR